MANKENDVLKQQMGELNSRVSSPIEEVKAARRKAKYVDSEVDKRYNANFHLTKAYQSFVKYWRRYAYTEVVEWIEVNA